MKFQAFTVSLSAFPGQNIEMTSKDVKTDLRRSPLCPKLRRFSDVLQIKIAQKNIEDVRKICPVHQKRVSNFTHLVFVRVLIEKSGVRARIWFQSHTRKSFSDI